MGFWSKVSNALLAALAGYEVGNIISTDKKDNDSKNGDQSSWGYVTMLLVILCILKKNEYYKNYVNRKVRVAVQVK